jgi:imidazolonepropionase-like amidohydrolase
MSTIVVQSGTVVTGDGHTVMPRTDVVIRDGKIAELLPSDDQRSYGQADQVISAAGMVVIPGLINNHSHGTAFGPLFPSGHTALSQEQVLANLDTHLSQGTTTVLCVDGFVTAEGLERTNAAHAMNIRLASCNTPSCLDAAQIADGSGLQPENVKFTADIAVREGAVALGEIGAGHTLGGGGASYMYIPDAVEKKTGKRITPAEANALKYSVLGRHIDSTSYDESRVEEVIAELGLAGKLTPPDAKEIIGSIILPAFETALEGLAEAAEHGSRLDVPVLVHNAAASMRQVARIAKQDLRLIAGHSNHDSFTVQEAVEHAQQLRELGVVIDVSTLDAFRARRLVESPHIMFTMLQEGLVDTISTDYAAGFHDPILLAISEAVKAGVVELPAAIAMASANVADAIPGVAPNRGRIGPGMIADVVVADEEHLEKVETVLVGGSIAFTDPERKDRP